VRARVAAEDAGDQHHQISNRLMLQHHTQDYCLGRLILAGDLAPNPLEDSPKGEGDCPPSGHHHPRRPHGRR
jgi:hypothetical protein